MRLLIVGGSGMLGSTLAHLALERGHEVTVSTRQNGRPDSVPEGAAVVRWDTRSVPDWTARQDAVVQLGGQSIFGGFWSRAYKKRLWESRADANRHLATWMQRHPHPPGVFITASAVGYYGAAPAGLVAEDAPPGTDFLARLCVAWEEAAQEAAAAGTRIVATRFGIMLERGGGALGRLVPIFWLGVGGRIGSGRQPFPWVTTRDAARAILHAAEDDAFQGPLNVVAPQRVDNRTFTRALAEAMSRPAIVPVPALALRLLYGDGAEVLVQGQEVVPARLKEAGFAWDDAEIGPALRQVLEQGQNA